jgi:alpha-glucoside transport system permease protein
VSVDVESPPVPPPTRVAPAKQEDPIGSKRGGWFVRITILVIIVLWLIPTIGVLITSFRPEALVDSTGWWTALAHPAVPWIVAVTLAVAGIICLARGYLAAGIVLVVLAVFAGTAAFVLDWSGDAEFTLENYRAALESGGFGNAFLNSLAVTIPSTVIPIAIAAFAAYAFSWMEFRGRYVLFVIVVGLLVVPLQMALIPILRLYTRGSVFGFEVLPDLGLAGTFLGVWLAHTGFGLPLATYLLRNFIGALPSSIIESAKIDGADHFTIFWRLIVPLSVPALAAFAIFQFLWVWNDLLVALVFLGGAGQNRVLTIALSQLVGARGENWHLLTAAAFISMALPLAVFFSLQKYFVRGLTAGAVKG